MSNTFPILFIQCNAYRLHYIGTLGCDSRQSCRPLTRSKHSKLNACVHVYIHVVLIRRKLRIPRGQSNFKVEEHTKNNIKRNTIKTKV